MLCEQYCIMLEDPQGMGASTYSRGYGTRDQVATAIKHLSRVVAPLPEEVLQLTEERMLQLGVDKGHPRQMRMVLGAFAQHAYLPSVPPPPSSPTPTSLNRGPRQLVPSLSRPADCCCFRSEGMNLCSTSPPCDATHWMRSQHLP